MRRGIAEHMRRSLDTSAHVTSAIEVDMTKVVAIREKLKKEYQSAYGVNPTYLAFVARATVETLRDYPYVNGELRGDQIVTRNFVNLGFAVELADGKGLIVPVVKNAETLNLLGMAKGIADIAERARDKQLTPDDVAGGTFTITNPGGYGTFHGTPMISQPQVAILGTYAIVKRPWVITDDNGADAIAIRSIMNLTLTYDHRLVDGALRRPLPPRPARAPADLGRERLLSPVDGCLRRCSSSTSASSTTARRSRCSARSRPRSRAGTRPDTVLLLEHPPTITLGRRTEEGELHVPEGATSRSSRPTAAASRPTTRPGQLVCYPILDLTRHGQDVKRYCRDLEEALIRTIAAFGVDGDADRRADRRLARAPPRKIASIGIHLTRWISTHGYALNVDLDPAPFTDWITACGLDGYAFTSIAQELGRPVVGRRRPPGGGAGVRRRLRPRRSTERPPCARPGRPPREC